MFQRSDIKEGMVVRSIDGEKLGKVFAMGDDAFHIERGLFFPKDYRVAFTDVSDIRDGEVVLTRGKESLQQVSEAQGARTTEGRTVTETTTTRIREADIEAPAASVTPLTGGLGARPDAGYAAVPRAELDNPPLRADSGDISIPVHREKLNVEKHETQAGELRVRKDVVEEEEVVRVPVRHERVRVERRAVTTERPAMEAAFKEETIVVPLRAEEVEVTKRSFLDEEVVIHKDVVEEERRIAETVRHENVEIRTEGEVDAPRTLNATSDDPSLTRS
ncbi:YsnF/AvaK domain-containing protein [Myxococcus stipitatus]|uniref:YsnF/AvaK domain-containing protein n=1 Tax=Myxococcus stipitatus TaxID=83455 RepID=UPI0030D1EEB9